MVIDVKFGVVVEKDEDGYYVASVPELPGCHTQAKTLDKVMERIKEAIPAYLEAEGQKSSLVEPNLLAFSLHGRKVIFKT